MLTQFIAWSASAKPLQLEGLTLELVSEKSGISPGIPFSVGLHIRHSTGFHTYWKNPGIVGVPTKIDWKLPPGFVAGPIEWPQPQLSKMAIYPVYGYEGEILLPVTITPPKELNTNEFSRITLNAKVSWMCCSNTCHPGFSDLTLTLPTSNPGADAANTQHQKQFHAARAARPIQTKDWRLTASQIGNKIVAEVRPATEKTAALLPSLDPASLYFFSSDGLIDSRGAQKFQPLTGKDPGMSVVLTVSEHAMKPEDGEGRLIGVLAAKQPWISGNAATAIAVDVPIAPGNGDNSDG